jgi:hypothetical protein
VEGDTPVTATSPVLVTAIVVLLLVVAPAYANGSVQIYVYSQKASDESARAGGSISYHESSGGSPGSQVSYSTPNPEERPTDFGQSTATPTSSASAGRITPCAAAGEGTVSPCYGVISNPTPASGPAPKGKALPPVNPAVLAASAADRLSLTPGRIEVSPSAQIRGLTGFASWFWLSPSPAPQSLSVALRGERVTVSATVGGIVWSFGDRASMIGGPGVPYRDGKVPTGAVRHIYQTRCLPGDAGRDPYVLSSCGPGGYTVTATVDWTITYTASGRIAGGGNLPARTTATSVTYPVSEARGFLTRGGSS